MHHDEVLGRLTDGEGRLDRMSAAELKRVPFRDSDERMMTLGELCDLVAGRATHAARTEEPVRRRSAAAGAGRGGACRLSRPGRADVVRSRCSLHVLRQKAPRLPRGIVAAKYRPHPYWDQMPPWLRYGMGSLLPALTARPQFVAYADRQPAGIGAVFRAARFVPAAGDLGGADAGGTAARRPLCRPDDFRRLSAMS